VFRTSLVELDFIRRLAEVVLSFCAVVSPENGSLTSHDLPIINRLACGTAGTSFPLWIFLFKAPLFEGARPQQLISTVKLRRCQGQSKVCRWSICIWILRMISSPTRPWRRTDPLDEFFGSNSPRSFQWRKQFRTTPWRQFMQLFHPLIS
jgi:hypothetical protein